MWLSVAIISCRPIHTCRPTDHIFVMMSVLSGAWSYIVLITQKNTNNFHVQVSITMVTSYNQLLSICFFASLLILVQRKICKKVCKTCEHVVQHVKKTARKPVDFPWSWVSMAWRGGWGGWEGVFKAVHTDWADWVSNTKHPSTFFSNPDNTFYRRKLCSMTAFWYSVGKNDADESHTISISIRE